MIRERAFRKILGPDTGGPKGEPVYTTYPGDTQPAWIGWTTNDKSGEYIEGYVAEDGPTPGTFDTPLNWVEVSFE